MRHRDLDVTGLLQRELTLDRAVDKLLECMLRTANGRLTAAEVLGHREFVLTRLPTTDPKAGLASRRSGQFSATW